jgi:adenine-specific DNA methylase
MTKRAIEESFPIAEINRLAVPERNAFKPIYQMHKWFARRASCVFRAILLASMKPAGTNIMEEFYKDHTEDTDTNNVRILDPFMGGGTTIVEALRLGCRVTGIDLNPVAWFIVKTEVEPVEIDQLQSAFKRLEERRLDNGRTLKEELLGWYKTECPCCGAGREDADIIYTFWVKSAICTNPTCQAEVPLFSNYIVAQKSPTIRYLPDILCNNCKKPFDIDLEPASLIAEKSLTVLNPKDSSGDLRSNKRWALFDETTSTIACPWCDREQKDLNVKILKEKGKLKPSKKKVPLTVLLCPHCFAVWQYRGSLPESVTCPVCSKTYEPNNANVTSKGEFVCSACGTKDKIINSIRRLPEGRLLPTRPYAVEGYCALCAGDAEETDMFGMAAKETNIIPHPCNIRKNNGKFFKRISPADMKRYQDAEAQWERSKERLPYPKSKIPDGQETHRLLEHHYYYWHQMFNPRQLLCLSTLLAAIDQEPDQTMKEMLLTAFFTALEANNMFSRYDTTRYLVAGVFARHDFQPKITICENNVYGVNVGARAYLNNKEKVVDGKTFNRHPFDKQYNLEKLTKTESKEKIPGQGESQLLCHNSQFYHAQNKYDLVITDPPYAGNVNYSELSDFFYVWLRLVLNKTYPHFSPETTPKIEEIVENPTRGKTAVDYEKGLTSVWMKCHEHLKNNGLMVFTFHHAEGSTWESLLESLLNAGFSIEAIYPIHGEAENSLHLMDKEAISYDLIHVCAKRNGAGDTKQRSWAGIRQEIRRRAREEVKMIETKRYGSERLSPADVNIILIGKCLELYSRHYGSIVDHEGQVVPLSEALASIRMMVDQLINTQYPLPSELEHIDKVSYVYFTCLCDRKEIQSDEVHKTIRGIMEVEELIKAGVMRKGRAKRGRTYEVKTPDERFGELSQLFKKKNKAFGQMFLFPDMEEEKFDNISLVDVMHYLMGLAAASENLMPWVIDFKAVIPQIRVGLDYLRQRNPTFVEPINTILGLIEV